MYENNIPDKVRLHEQLNIEKELKKMAELTVQKREEETAPLKQKMEADIQNILVENNEKIMQLNMKVAEHEGCNELVANLKLAQNQLDHLLAYKLALDEELKAEKELNTMSEITVQKRKEAIVSLKQKIEADFQNILVENNEKIMQLNMKVAEHEACMDLVANLKLAQNQLDQLLVEKVKLDEQLNTKKELKKMAELTVQKREEEVVHLKKLKMEADIQNILFENNEKIMQLSMLVTEDEECKKLVANLKLAQNQLDHLLADTLALDEELKAEKELNKMSEITVQKRKEEIVSLKQKIEADFQNILVENNEKIMQLRVQVAEHEGCKELAANLKLAQNQRDQLLTDKQALDKELKAERDFKAKTQKREEDFESSKQKMEAEIQNILVEKNGEIKQLNMQVAELEACKELAANVKLAQNQRDQLLADKLALEEELKAEKEFNAKTQLTVQNSEEEIAEKENQNDHKICRLVQLSPISGSSIMAANLASPDQLKNKNTYKNANRITYYEDETTKKRYYKCPICSKMLSGHLTTHIKNVHFGADSWPCEVCGKNLASESGLKAHMPIHEPEKRFKCAHCGKGFDSKRNLQRHIPRHLEKTPLQCTDCQQQFSSKKLLDEHRSVHTEEALLCEPYVCEEEDCAKEFAEEHLLNQHIHEHTMSQFPYDCEKCPERFSKKIELKRHEKVSHDEGYEETYRHACDMCSRRYKKKSDLTYHKKQVHNDDPDSLKKHQCSECPKKFLRKTDLNIHMVVHSTEQNFECEECGKKFKLQKSLKRHQEKENHAAGEKQPFWCNFCKTALSSALDLSEHMILSHAKCLICSEQLANKKRLNVHMNTVHCELFTVPPTN